jgi:hypothetical protein
MEDKYFREKCVSYGITAHVGREKVAWAKKVIFV